MSDDEFTDLREWVWMNTEVGMPDDTAARIYLGELRTLLAAHDRLAPSAPFLEDAQIGTVVQTADDVALSGGVGTAEQARDLAARRFVRVQDGGRTDWVSCDPDRVVITFWASSDLLFALGAVVISVPVEVGRA
ncbi:hypothetical protein [Frankia sp. AgW1.1]|uniref:hypothetical protein n=1 Tax=Frankia sp. AgW1.1 TaxID=1836971 RepID=UPI00193475E3|nr:hypothetical protein [Frankia sp. AgW1.1]MBL7487157.1 hypothetical protein [Frankia sp. AgW1.1]